MSEANGSMTGMDDQHGSFLDPFDAPRLDTRRWLPHYLPQWSSREESAATFEVTDSELRLTVPADQELWCADLHPEPLRVSGIQSGVYSGPVGSEVGQQPFLEHQRVREHQPAWWGWTPQYGRIEVVARMELSPRSMASVWLVGLEDQPDRCGEICLFEVFGDTVNDGSARVGSGLHPFRDPALHEEFSAEHQSIDVTMHHSYAIDWRPDGVDFLIDGEVTRTSNQSPAYPMQTMIGVFDFPAKGGDGSHVPRLAIDSVSCQRPVAA